MTFEPDCLEEASDKCIVHKGRHDFVGTIKILGDIDKRNFSVYIMIGGIKEMLTLDIDVIKNCECNTTDKSPICNGFGDRRCGMCECTPGRLIIFSFYFNL